MENFNIATDIDTDIFFAIRKFLIDNDWNIKAEYDPEIFDKAIDFDYYLFEKQGESIEMVWDIWCRGEIKTSDTLFAFLAKQFGCEFRFGNPTNFKDVQRKSPLYKRY
ncbi:MAG: hypothetical protein Q4C98_03690 [Capnocytophaga sp.]|nr:hypothetical protein [Capnocytophaga sp.]